MHILSKRACHGVHGQGSYGGNFLTVKPEMTVREAVEVFRQATAATGQRVFGLMVTSDQGKLVGMLSMYDIFLVLRPKHIHIWGRDAGSRPLRHHRHCLHPCR